MAKTAKRQAARDKVKAKSKAKAAEMVTARKIKPEKEKRPVISRPLLPITHVPEPLARLVRDQAPNVIDTAHFASW